MATLGGFYLDPHRTQFDGSALAGENCTPTSGANGANASTGGRVNLSGAQVRAKLARWEETDPSTPGWSIPDLDKAMARLGVPFENRTGQGWAAIASALNAGLYVAIQGDSDRFSNATCSGAFNGDHCVGVHPATQVLVSGRQRWLDDPICKTGRWEYDSVIRAYAEKLNASIRFGAFTTPVPRVASSTTRYRVSISGYTPLYSSPNGTRVGAVSAATYICTRAKVDGAWWYRIVSKVDGSHTANAGRYFKPNAHVIARYA